MTATKKVMCDDAMTFMMTATETQWRSKSSLLTQETTIVTMRGRKNAIRLSLVSIALYAAANAVLISIRQVPSIDLDESASLQPPTKQSRLVKKLEESPKTSKSNSKSNNTFIFIGIKTSEAGVHGQRLPQIEQTWLKDALATNLIDIKFFTHAQVNQTSDSSSLMVSTACNSQDLACKTSGVFAYFLTNTTAPWFCSFDDDNYVLVDNLIKLLKTYNATKDWYLGKPTGPGIFYSNVNARIRHATGGAGYCFSRPLVERGKDLFSNLKNTSRLADDLAVGHVSQNLLGVNLTCVNGLLHSHYERTIRKRIPREEVSKHVTFGRDNKGDYGNPPVDHMPNVPILFPPEEDPLSFRSLWCFLHESKRNSSECTPLDRNFTIVNE